MRERLSPALAAAALLGISRLLPESGFGLWLRLAAATAILLLPGRYVARAIGVRGTAATLSWSLALTGVGLAVAVALHTSLDATLALVLAAGAVAAILPERAGERVSRVRGPVALVGLAYGGAIWFVESVIDGDALFHLGRIRKLLDLGSLSLHGVGEFAHGGLHPGYAFPLWHAWLGLVARLAGVDPAAVVSHESSLLVPLALVLAFEMGRAVFRNTWLALATMLGQVALISLAPGAGGAYTQLTGPGTSARQLLVPAATALFFRFVRRPSPQLGVTLAAASAAISFVHPTYALFLAIPLAAFAVARALLARGADLREGALALLAFVVSMLAVFAWLRPIVNETVSVNPGPEQLAQSLRHYAGDLHIHSLTRYALDPSLVDRTGSVAIAALVLAPLALFARRRRWSAYVLGGTAAVLALELWPFVFPHFADAASLSQARRAAGFVPFAFAFAGGAALLARVSRVGTLALALGAGIWLQLDYPGDFGLRTAHDGPVAIPWIALYGSLAALALGTALARRSPLPAEERAPRGLVAAVAAGLFVLPVAIHGFAEWRAATPRDAYALTPGLVRYLQQEVPARAVVFADLETSYRAVAFAPVYVVAAPPAHVANTKPNQVRRRRAAVLHFFARPDLAIPRRWGAEWLVLRRHEKVEAVEALGLAPVYRDEQFVVFRLPPH
ncbi:MAG TPA: hypothetical protein VFJ77_11385 [Gaiellaceae bacterium]|nr:hypothetical protein [Gaiellaceae bacterium]